MNASERRHDKDVFAVSRPGAPREATLKELLRHRHPADQGRNSSLMRQRAARAWLAWNPGPDRLSGARTGRRGHALDGPRHLPRREVVDHGECPESGLSRTLILVANSARLSQAVSGCNRAKAQCKGAVPCLHLRFVRQPPQ